MKKYLFPLGFFILLSGFSAYTQTPPPVSQKSEDQTVAKTGVEADEENSDLVITATVRARELKFEIVPDPKVEFPGRADRQTVWDSDRENLPEKVEPGVTYRDIGIRLRIYSRFAEIQRIVLEAIDEDQPPGGNGEIGSTALPAKKNAVLPPESTAPAVTTVKRPIKRSPKK